jgi:hypothetical protein
MFASLLLLNIPLSHFACHNTLMQLGPQPSDSRHALPLRLSLIQRLRIPPSLNMHKLHLLKRTAQYRVFQQQRCLTAIHGFLVPHPTIHKQSPCLFLLKATQAGEKTTGE